MPGPKFSAETLTFLRELKLHNDRDWFREHRELYEAHVRAPMLAVIEQLAIDLPAFAPELVASTRTSMYRIYRDTRFSADKSPYKTWAAAIFPFRGGARHEGAGLYVHVSAADVMVGGGVYAPTPQHLQRLREHVAANSGRLDEILAAPAFRRSYGELGGEQLKRVPRGFPADHPAADYLRHKQYLAGCNRPSDFATGPRFYSSLLRLFRNLSPLIGFLNEPLAGKRFAL